MTYFVLVFYKDLRNLAALMGNIFYYHLQERKIVLWKNANLSERSMRIRFCQDVTVLILVVRVLHGVPVCGQFGGDVSSPSLLTRATGGTLTWQLPFGSPSLADAQSTC